MKPKVITADDLYKFAAGLRNSGVTDEFLAMSEAQTLVRLFGRKNARMVLAGAADTENPESWIKILVAGEDGGTFSGLKAICSLVACITLISQGRVQTGRVNAAHQPLNSKAITVRDNYEVIQSLAGMAEFQINELIEWLKIKTDANGDPSNTWGLQVQGTIRQVPYSVNSSGRIPAAWSWLGIGV